MYLRALKTTGNLKISYGHFLTHSCHMVLTGSTPPKKVWVDKTEEKGSDVNIASTCYETATIMRLTLPCSLQTIQTS